MAKITPQRVNTKKIVGSVFLGVLLASVAWLGIGFINHVRTQRNLQEAEQLYKDLSHGKLTAHNLERSRYLLNALPTRDDRFRMFTFIFMSAAVNPRNNAKVLSVMLEYMHNPDPAFRANAIDMAASCGKGVASVHLRLQQLAQSDPSEAVRSKAQKILVDFNAP